MASLECFNCNKMLCYDKNDNLLVIASSNFTNEIKHDTLNIDIKCMRCKKHNHIILK